MAKKGVTYMKIMYFALRVYSLGPVPAFLDIYIYIHVCVECMFHVLGRGELEATKISSRSWIHLFIVKLQQTRLPAELENPAAGQGEMENNGFRKTYGDTGNHAFTDSHYIKLDLLTDSIPGEW